MASEVDKFLMGIAKKVALAEPDLKYHVDGKVVCADAYFDYMFNPDRKDSPVATCGDDIVMPPVDMQAHSDYLWNMAMQEYHDEREHNAYRSARNARRGRFVDPYTLKAYHDGRVVIPLSRTTAQRKLPERTLVAIPVSASQLVS